MFTTQQLMEACRARRILTRAEIVSGSRLVVDVHYDWESGEDTATPTGVRVFVDTPKEMTFDLKKVEGGYVWDGEQL